MLSPERAAQKHTSGSAPQSVLFSEQRPQGEQRAQRFFAFQIICSLCVHCVEAFRVRIFSIMSFVAASQNTLQNILIFLAVRGEVHELED